MKTYMLIAPALLLAACTAQSPDDRPAADATAGPASATASTAQPPASPRTATATGTIDAIDAATGKVTITHGPVPSLGWPAMTMPFRVSPEQAAELQPGQEVTFEFEESTTRILRIEPVGK